MTGSLAFDGVVVEYNSVLIDGAPEIVLHTLDPDENFIHVPLVSWPWPVARQAVGKTRGEFFVHQRHIVS